MSNDAHEERIQSLESDVKLLSAEMARYCERIDAVCEKLDSLIMRFDKVADQGPRLDVIEAQLVERKSRADRWKNAAVLLLVGILGAVGKDVVVKVYHLIAG